MRVLGGYHAAWRILLGGAAAIALLGATPAFAQTAPSDSAMVNLVRLLIEQGVLTAEKGAALMSQAQAEANQARTAAATAPSAQVASGTLPPPPAGTVRVPYVPESVRAQIRDELRDEVLARAKTEGWAAPGQAAPGWVNQIALHGDLRLRSASEFYSSSNSNQIVNVPDFNTFGPFDITSGAPFAVPLLNTTLDRVNRLQVRARIGIEATIAKRFQIGFQLASGQDASPISTNALLSGGFRKKDLWLQLAYARGEIVPGYTAIVGRFDNPLATTDLMYDPDLAFDGVAGLIDVARIFGNDDWVLGLRGGAFPLDFGDDNFPTRSFEKRNFRDRYLFSGQLEAGKDFENGIAARVTAAYHNFRYLRGHVSDPCDVYSLDVASTQCSTDDLRPLTPTKGNTLMFLRRFDTSQQGSAPLFEPQYLGLKYGFRVLDFGASAMVPLGDDTRVKITGNYLHNLGVDPENDCREGPTGGPINNTSGIVCATATQPSTGRYIGSNEAWGGYLSIGYPELFTINPRRARQGRWAINAGYKRLGSDAVPDSFTDSDFHLGGTNAKGYFVGGAYAVYDNVTLSGRWLSSNEIVGEPLAIDVLQIDLGLAF